MKKLTPFNIELMFAPDSTVRQLRPTTKTDIYDGVTNNFDDSGLFSTVTFGKVGSPERDDNFSYIRMNADIIHPAIFNVLKKLKSLYVDIMMGTAYAKWNPELKDFESSDMLEGDTGMAFFTRHIHHLEPDKRKSVKRNMYVDVFNRYQKECLMHNHLVIPAGLRDLYVDKEGREVQDEINDLYRKLIAIASSINLVGGKQNDPVVDTPRKSLQLTANEIYEYLKRMLEGKKGLVQAKWGGRKLVNGTRNVISSIDTTAYKLQSPKAPHVDHTQIGIFQCLKSSVPIAIHHLKRKFLDQVFVNASSPTTLIRIKDLKPEEVEIDPYTWDKWATTEGLEKIIDGFSDQSLRNKPIVVEKKYYLFLTYQKDNVFKIFRNINELPDPSMLDYVHPTTYAELFYLCNYEGWYRDLRALCTRYPIAGMYSIYPAKIYVRTTVGATTLNELGDDWQTVVGTALEFPVRDRKAIWIDTAIVSYTRLAKLGGDYDGDTISVNVIYSKEAVAEIDALLASKRSVVGPDGRFIASADTAIPGRVFNAWT